MADRRRQKEEAVWLNSGGGPTSLCSVGQGSMLGVVTWWRSFAAAATRVADSRGCGG